MTREAVRIRHREYAATGVACQDGSIQLIVLASISVLIRAITTRRALQIVLAIIGLIGVVSAWTSGAGFVGDGADSASFSMATTTALAIAAYATALFAVPAVQTDKS